MTAAAALPIVARLAAAGLASWAAGRWLIDGGDPLRSTLLLLPFVLVALGEIGRFAHRHGGRRTLARAGSGEAAALALLVFLALGRGALGVRYGQLLPPLLMAGLFLLLAVRVACLLLALRPTLGDRLPRRPPPVFFLLPLTVYLAILPWSTQQRPPDGDEPHYLLITHSLAWDFDQRLSNNYEQGDSLAFMDRRLKPQTGDPVGADGENFSRHNATLPLLLAPAYRVGGKLGALATMAALAAALAWATLALARHYQPASPGAALAAWSVLAFAAPLLLYSHQAWVEVPAALLAVIALERIERLRDGEGLRLGGWAGIALPLMLLPLLKFRLAIIGGGLVLLLLVAGLRRRRGLVLAVVAGFAAVAAAVLGINQLLFGNPLRYYSFQATLNVYRTSPLDYVRGLAGLLGDCAFGLVAFAPVWLLLIPGVIGSLRCRRLLISLGLVFAPYLILFGPRGEWFGGWSPPFRYAMVALPMLAILLIPAFEERRRWIPRIVIAALAALTLVLTLVWVALPGWTYNLADGRSHLLDSLTLRLGGDVARFFPSYVRLRPAAWIWAVAAATLAGLWWLGGRSQRRVWKLGPTLLLGAAALLPLAVARAPTRVVELEDPYVGKSGGRLYPERWAEGRTRYRGGWLFEPGTRVRATVVPASRRLALEIDLRRFGHPGIPLEMVVREGDEERCRLPVGGTAGWHTVAADEIGWSGGRILTLELLSPPEDPEAARPRVGVDRVRLEWRPAGSD